MNRLTRRNLWLLLSAALILPATTPEAKENRDKRDGDKKDREKDRDKKDKDAPSDEERARFEAALKVLQTTTDRAQMLAAERVLLGGFPKSRDAVHEGVSSASPWARASALKILGERGDPKHDQKIVERGLQDRSPTVRVTAVMAMRRLGDAGFDALARYLPTEKKPNIRKMAVRTFQAWNNPDAIPLLVDALKRERKKTVRLFIVRALEALSLRRLGDDVAAWEEVASTYLSEKQRESLIDSLDSKEVKKK